MAAVCNQTTPRPKKANSTNPPSSLLPILLLFPLAILLFSFLPPLPCSPPPSPKQWSGDLRSADFPLNSLPFPSHLPPLSPLKIAVFSRNWPSSPSSPGGMERHALTLHSSLSLRGHQIHVFTSHIPPTVAAGPLLLHPLPGPWRPADAFRLFQSEHSRAPFDVVHSQSVALFHRFAPLVPNLAVSWHGIALESLHSSLLPHLPPHPPSPPSSNRTLAAAFHKLIHEIRFFHTYPHHVAITHSAAAILRDVYQIPPARVHLILNGVNADDFRPDPTLRTTFRAQLRIPLDAPLVIGTAGRLVKDKGHPLLFQAFSKITNRHPNIYLLVAGAGPWEHRYRELGTNVVVAGALPPAKLRAFYNAIDVFVNPTLRPQGLDLTLIEAMQCGTPVMATRFPSITGSVVVNEELGVMFAPNAAALEEAIEVVVAAGKARMAEMGRACRKYAAGMFTASKMAMAYERLFLCIKNERFCKYPLESDY